MHEGHGEDARAPHTERGEGRVEAGTGALTIGFIGAGVMARGMVHNLLRAGHRVRLTNRTRAHAEPLLRAGAQWADSPREAVDGADLAASCVTDGEAVREVALGPQGIIHAPRAPRVFVDLSTIAPAEARDIAHALGTVGIAMVDAPVTGGDRGAQEGTLTLFVGGPAEAIQAAQPLFAAVGRTVHRMGDIGQGQAMKLMQNLVGGLNLLAAVEGAALAEAYGLDPVQVLGMLRATTSQSRMAEVLEERLVSGDRQPGFSVANRLKDFYLALEMAHRAHVPSPLAAVGAELMAEAMALGWGDLDQTVVRMARRRTADG